MALLNREARQNPGFCGCDSLLKHPGFMEKILAAEEEGQIERLIIQTDESIP
ncbi:MAG: hypothetical protein K6360_03485 [Deltaproteobacteria bacterium]